MIENRIDEIMSKVKGFPSMPATGAKLLNLLENQEASVDEIEDVLRYDPGLTANILKLANSVYFGIPSKVGSVRQAVILLGLKRLLQLVIASCVGAVMDHAVPGYDLAPGDLWRHSIAVSIAAEALVKDKKKIAGEDVFTPALLHDVGKLILGQFVKDDLANIREIAGKGVPFVIAENMVLGTDHAEVGALILKQWSFPDEIVNAVRWHHDPDSVEKIDLQYDVIYLANLLCQSTGGDEDDGQLIELSPSVIDRLGIEMSQFEIISDKVSKWVDELSDALTFS